MKLRINKTALRIAFAYVILTGGLRMFLLCYANSYNRLSEQKIPPARLTVSGSSAELDILGKSLRLRSPAGTDSRGFLAAYLLAPDELRAAALLASFLAERR